MCNMFGPLIAVQLLCSDSSQGLWMQYDDAWGIANLDGKNLWDYKIYILQKMHH